MSERGSQDEDDNNLFVPPNAPLKGGNEPLAQGTALGNKDNITDSALTGQKRYHKEENAFAPSGAELLHGI